MKINPQAHHKKGWIHLVPPAERGDGPLRNPIVMETVAAMVDVSIDNQPRFQKLEHLKNIFACLFVRDKVTQNSQPHF